tara:strand:+ start:1299 stop:1895 length:597 start_codon:yes stop_codon:yes gene_type:complete
MILKGLADSLFIRFIDIAIAIALLFPTIIFAAALKLLNYKYNPGPLIYSQTRVGIGGKLFKIYKFRSMCSHANHNLFADQQEDAIPIIGKKIRTYRIDELPQIFNVFRGDMSIIGPRPERPKFVEEYTSLIALYPGRHRVRPGITGLAQVMGGYTSSVEGTRQKIRYDLYFVRKKNVCLYIYIYYKTIGTIIFKRGAI